MTPSLLDTLPPELRNSVYRMALVSEDALRIHRDGKDVLGRTALLRSCRQIRSEATGIFYENAFSITCGSGGGRVGARWLKEMRSKMRKIAKIAVDFEMSASTRRLLNTAEYVIFEYESSIQDLDERRDAERDQVYFNAASFLINHLTDESLPLAMELSSAVKIGNITDECVEVRDPEVNRYRPLELTSENCLMFMYGLLEGLGQVRFDAMRLEMLHDSHGAGPRMHRFFDVYTWRGGIST